MKKAILSSEIDLRLRPSTLLWGWWWLFSMLMMISLWWTLPFAWAAAGMGIYCIASGWQWTQLTATSWKKSIQTLRVDVYGQMTVTNQAGQAYQASVLPDSIVHPWCLILHLQLLSVAEDSAVESSPYHQRILLLPDQADSGTLSALRVWLRWGQD
jgi:hypothetical protein